MSRNMPFKIINFKKEKKFLKKKIQSLLFEKNLESQKI